MRRCILCDGELEEVIADDGNRYYEYSDHVCTVCGQEYVYTEGIEPILTDDQKRMLKEDNLKKG